MDELTMQDLRDAFADKAESKGMEVVGKGHGYSNGTFFDMEAKSPTGLRIYVTIEESRDEEYLRDRQEEETTRVARTSALPAVGVPQPPLP